MTGTLSEHENELPPALISVLSVVLNYDDLLVEQSGVFVLEGTVTLSRNPRPGVQGVLQEGRVLTLPDSWVSTEHASLQPIDGGYRIRDNQSRNGTYVSGHPVETQALEDGDLIEVGHTLLCYRRVDARVFARYIAGNRNVPLGPTCSRNAELADLASRIQVIGPTREPVLVLGETGTGKDVVACALHEWSGRPGQLRAIDCGAIPEGLFESTLFGHRRGAFSGALEARTGEIALADRGTLFLDEVANLGAPAQAKLLRCLETGVLTPLGTSEEKRVDFRVVAATNEDLLSEQSSFRLDLRNRLSGFVARLPPLRQRREDLGVLTRHFLREAGVTRASVRSAAARRLFNANFPGNLRQLRAVLRSAATFAAGGPIDLVHLPSIDSTNSQGSVGTGGGGSKSSPPAASTRRVMQGREEVATALERAHGNVTQAAEAMGVHVRQLYRWMERFELSPAQFRRGG